MELNKLYFYTATILDWKPLLSDNKYKDLIIESLTYLVKKGCIKMYGFVIMPNHIHLIWELLKMNGKELPHASFMKFTSHQIRKDLMLHHPVSLSYYQVNSLTRVHQFWQRDALPIYLYSPKVIYQKLDYIHRNPVRAKWMLVASPPEYHYSSAKFYETGIDTFGLLTHIGERI
ncbi:putative transposase [Catalinimonas alkaloidigena]|uniref:transposase n=1 Tax=Catalinimonas alkaloidigena TaxID=1075417 RepID=UPI00240695B4|nr:transposase [Catalinimonas alkaloidigena]MDF9796094.1 putative transposase [Catalinimonas alkaloidigena]